MKRHIKPPITEEQLWQEGPPVRVRDLVALTGNSQQTVLCDIRTGPLKDQCTKRDDKNVNAAYRIPRAAARAYVDRMTGRKHAC